MKPDPIKDHRAYAQWLVDERLRTMTPAEKMKVIHDLYWSARRMKTTSVRSEHPGWTEEQVECYVRDLFMYARS